VTGAGQPALEPPALILAADHRARGVVTVERYADYLGALRAALPSCDGILASTQPLRQLAADGLLRPPCRSYLSVNRTGIAGSAFELDDRLVASIDTAAGEGWTGIKHMVRIDLADPAGAGALELLGQVLDQARRAGLEALVETVVWRDGSVARDTDSVVLAAVVAHDLGAPLLKVPVPHAEPGSPRVEAVARVVASVGVPVLFLGGPPPDAAPSERRRTLLHEVDDVMEGGAAGVALGRRLYLDGDPAELAKTVAEIVHRR